MPQKTELHPEEVAKLFGVHKRTIFRWIKRKHLKNVNGKVQMDGLQEKLSLWKNSVPRHEARKRLRVRVWTLNTWISHGYLETVSVMGETRVITTSLVNAPQKRIGLSLDLRRFVNFNQLIVMLDTSSPTLNKYANIEFKVQTSGKHKVVTEEEAHRLIELKRSSFSTKETCQILDVNKKQLKQMVKSKELELLVLLGRVRVTKKSVRSMVTKIASRKKLQEIGLAKT